MYEAKEFRRRVLGPTKERKDNSKRSSKPPDKIVKKEQLNRNASNEIDMGNTQPLAAYWWGALAFVTVLSVSTRLYKIDVPSQIW